jgi:acyl-coenzyme A thioesterase PaaI-like protein
MPPRHPDAPRPGEEIPSHFVRCVGCGAAHPTGLHLHVVADEGMSVTGIFTVTEDHQGAPGLAHGGMLALAFDEVLGSLAWLVRAPSVTARLETDFRRPVPVGTTLVIRARIEGQHGRRLFVSADGHLDAPDGHVAVRARATFMVVPLQHFRDHGRPEVLAGALERGEVRAASPDFEVNP